ncbi:MAG TPA: FhaA domain-containing protein [Aggregatilineaceae bacterium]|nr:FhaA domain-containing protein [Aggregatilineaceae bacterium]
MNRWRFSQLEQRIEQIIEGSFARLFAGRLSSRDVVNRLARAMEDAALPQEDGGLVAPNAYTVHLNQDDYQKMHESLVGTLKDTVIELALRLELRLLTPPLIKIVPSAIVAPRSVIVQAEHRHDAVPEGTQGMYPTLEANAETPKMPRNPQLIVNGSRYIELTRPVINLGRRSDNQVVLDDPRVSRTHAQLRLRFGHYTLFDLSSTGGTLVNNQPITEYVLKSGDVISLAGVMLVYVDDEAAPKLSPTDTEIRRPKSWPDADDAPTR